jgi:hypothetical protein
MVNISCRMALATVAILVVVYGAGLIIAWEYVPSAVAQDLFNCDSFGSQGEAQDKLREAPNDPYGLDGPPGPTTDGIPGVACDSFNYPPGSPIDYTPAFPFDESTTPPPDPRD